MSRRAGEESKPRVLARMLRHAAFDGWSEGTFRRAVADAGLSPAEADRLFPGGARDVLVFHMDTADRELAEGLGRHDLDGLGVRAQVTLAVRLRLERAEPHREAVRRAFAYLSLPGNSGLAARGLHRTVDTIWRAVGDRSTDFNYYTKRGLLAGVYLSSVLYWLGDESAGRRATWAFLDRRIAEVMAIEKARRRLERLRARAPSPWRLLARLRHGPGAGGGAGGFDQA